MPRAARILHRIFVSGAVLYSLGLFLLILLWSTLAQVPWWLAVSAIFAPFWFMPLFLLVPLALFIRSRWLRGATLLMLALFLLLFGSWFTPKAQPEGEANLRLVSFNHLYHNEDIEAITSAILAQDADVVALQELSPLVANALEDLQDIFPYQSLYPSTGEYPFSVGAGLGLLSRYPFDSASYDETLGGQRVVVNVAGLPVTVFNVHLPTPFTASVSLHPANLLATLRSYNTSAHPYRLALLLAGIDREQGRLIVLGDFNISELEPDYRALQTRMKDVYRETASGFGFTFPNLKRVAPLPLVRIDYVWTAGDVLPVAARVDCRDTGSDHCLVVADVKVQ